MERGKAKQYTKYVHMYAFMYVGMYLIKKNYNTKCILKEEPVTVA